MKRLKIVIEFEINGDENDEESVKEDVSHYLQELIDDDSLEFTVIPDEDDEDT